MPKRNVLEIPTINWCNKMTINEIHFCILPKGHKGECNHLKGK